MKNTKISFEDAAQFSGLFLDYIQQKSTLKQFFHLPPTLSSFDSQIATKRTYFNAEKRTVLVATLKKQYEGITSFPAESIELLKNENTFTVTTGHQLNIFTGPLYFIYKIVSVINLSRKLSEAFPSQNFIPVYWMATEDHDFEEIRKMVLFGRDYLWNHAEPKGAVGRMDTHGIGDLIEQIGQVPDFIKEAYLENTNLASATRKLVNHLFYKEGLVIVDADDAALKKELIPVIEDDVLNHTAKEKADSTTKTLEDLGYKSQIFPRDINFFYLENNLRERIEREGDVFKVLNTDIVFSEQEIKNKIAENPICFSPNVVLRPLYQEMILPNLAYLGGPSEVAYWLQLKGVFDHYQVPFPILLPRNFAMVVNKSNGKKFQKLGLSHQDIFKHEHELRASFVKDNAEVNLELDEEAKIISNAFDGIMDKAVSIDASLKGYIGAESQRMLKQIDNIKKRLKKAEENKQETAVNQLLNLKEKLFPNGTPQERIENFLSFYLNNPHFIEALLTSFDPLDFTYNILEDE